MRHLASALIFLSACGGGEDVPDPVDPGPSWRSLSGDYVVDPFEVHSEECSPGSFRAVSAVTATDRITFSASLSAQGWGEFERRSASSLRRCDGIDQTTSSSREGSYRATEQSLELRWETGGAITVEWEPFPVSFTLPARIRGHDTELEFWRR